LHGDADVPFRLVLEDFESDTGESEDSAEDDGAECKFEDWLGKFTLGLILCDSLPEESMMRTSSTASPSSSNTRGRFAGNDWTPPERSWR
jgi:hypothetical protein